jgi:multimeric flavodoxin WrbA
MSSKPYIVIIYSGATNKGANSIIASYIAAGVKKSGMNVVGPIDINFQDSQEEENLITTITNSNGLIIGSGVYNGNIEPTLTEFFDKFAGAGFKSSFLASKVAGQFATAADVGTGGQLVLNSLSRLMQTFGANIVTGGVSKSTLGKPGSGSWHTAQGILGIVTKDKAGNPTFTNKYIQEDANAYGERIGQIASFFQDNYNKSMGIPVPQTRENFIQSCPECPVHKKNDKKSNQIWLIILITIMLLFFMTLPFVNI